jgi:hypothetical protein
MAAHHVIMGMWVLAAVVVAAAAAVNGDIIE